MNSLLKWDIFVSSQVPVAGDLPPGATEMKWSPISSTLISGERDAVLVDTFITVEQNRALTEWVAASGKNLTAIYATHGHGDHFFGVNAIQQGFPNARFVASRDAIEVMREQLSPPWLLAGTVADLLIYHQWGTDAATQRGSCAGERQKLR
jgi:glyoxylase-like metal-dependent hydrolase (beta-lactamase superfamily II)